MSMKNRKPTISNILYITSYILFALVFGYLCYTIRVRNWTWLDSDMSSELILAKMLKEEGSILSQGWFYGTELRILYYTQISAIIFNFTDNWYMVRVITNIIMIVIMLASIWCLALRLGVKKYFPVIGLILMLPFSMVYYRFILYGEYYIPCIATSFFGIALILHYIQTSDNKIRIAILAGSALLALVSSLIGYRQVVMFYLPAFMGAAIMLAIEIWRDHKPYKQADSWMLCVISLTDLISAGVGCLINSLILIKKYSVEDWNDLEFTNFSLDRLVETLNGIVRNLGYREESIGIGTLVSNGYSVLLFLVFIAAVYTAFKKRDDVGTAYSFCAIYSACAVILVCLLYALSDLGYSDRYSAPVTVFVIPVVIAFIAGLKIQDWIKPVLCITVGILACVVSVHNYGEIKNKDKTARQREIVAFLNDNDYHTGYGTYWNANVLTELSNGAIDMYDWHNEVMFPTVESVNSVWHWLQKVSHETERPSGKVFHIYDDDDLYYCSWKENLSDDDLVYRTGKYHIYGYDSYDEMMAKISAGDVDLSEYVPGDGDSAVLKSGETLSGQDMMFYGGTCLISVEGENLGGSLLSAKYYAEELDHSEEYDLSYVKQEDGEIIAKITVPEDTGRSKVELYNGSDDECVIKRIHIERTGP